MEKIDGKGSEKPQRKGKGAATMTDESVLNIDDDENVDWLHPSIRDRLVAIALQWQHLFGVAPAITSAVSEFDAATRLLGMTFADYQIQCEGRSAVTAGHDFVFKGCRYQIKSNRESGRPNAKARMVPKPKNYKWDRLIWIHYNREYEMVEAWQWEREDYRAKLDNVKYIRPAHMRQGLRIDQAD